MAEKNNDIKQNPDEQLKDDNGNPVKTTGGPDFKRLLIGISICIAMLLLAKLFGM